MEEFQEDEIESVLYIGREVSGTSHTFTTAGDALTSRAVYKIPPLKKNEGHRAQEWGDLAQPLWKGRLRIIERSNGVSIQFEDPNTGARWNRKVKFRSTDYFWMWCRRRACVRSCTRSLTVDE